MEKSQTISELAKALILFHVKVDKIPKTGTNPFFKSRYATLESVLDAINVPLNESGLAFVQFPSGEHGLTTILMHTSGEYISSEYFMKPSKDDPQGAGSVITYQRRYALTAVLGLAQEDDDANAGSQARLNGNASTTARPKLTPASDKWKGAVKALNEGQVKIEQIEAKYQLSKQDRELLLTESV